MATPLTLLTLTLTQPTRAVPTGAVYFAVDQGSGGPLTVQIPGISNAIVTPGSNGLPGGSEVAHGYAHYQAGIPPGDYEAIFYDASAGQQLAPLYIPFTIDPVPADRTGCTDEYASDYDPEANVAGACTYAATWRSAWQEMAVRVAVTDQAEAFVSAVLRVGFRPGHPLAEFRPLADAVTLRATIGPDGYATFRLGPYLRSLLGSDDGAGGYRLDINSSTIDDVYVGYELRRTTGELLEHGYALNAAVPDERLASGFVLSAFRQVPLWPGYHWSRQQLNQAGAGRYGNITDASPATLLLPCPPNALPVAWLNPQGGFDYWVFQGRPQLGDDIGEGQTYTEAGTGQTRYSERGAARRTVTATSGVFRGNDLLEGLRTLWRSPQAWYQPGGPGSEWVAITVEAGKRDVGRLGVLRNELSISFTEAEPQFVQGQ